MLGMLDFFSLSVFENCTWNFSHSLVFILCSFLLVGNKSSSVLNFMPDLVNFKQRFDLLWLEVSKFNVSKAFS